MVVLGGGRFLMSEVPLYRVTCYPSKGYSMLVASTSMPSPERS